MTYPAPPEPTDVELEAHEDQASSVFVFDEATETLRPIPEVALEDGGLTEEVMQAIHGGARKRFRQALYQEVLAERSRQLVRWGDQRRPLGASAAFKQLADIMRANCDEAEADGECTWRHITLEETYEAFSEEDRHAFRVEAVQTMAVLYSALEDAFRDEFES